MKSVTVFRKLFPAVSRFIFLSLALLSIEATANATISIGWSSISITPEKPIALAGQYHLRITRNVKDPVTATALAIEAVNDGRVEQVVMVSCDLLMIPPGLQSQVRQGLKNIIPELNAMKVLLNATHTHTGPEILEGNYHIPKDQAMQPIEYVEFLREKLIFLISQAWTQRQRGGISWALGHAVVGYNRLATYYNGRSVMYGKTARHDFSHIEGYEDHGMELLFFWNNERRLTGVLINIGCPSQVDEAAEFISADFWHDVRNKLKKKYTPDLFIYPMAGASGDQSPLPLSRLKAEKRLLTLKGHSLREEIGDRILIGIQNAYDVARTVIQNDLPFVHKTEDIFLPKRMVSKAEFENAKRELERLKKGHGNERHRHYLMNRHMGVVERYHKQASEPLYRMELHVMRIGDVAIVTNPFELYLDFGMQIKARSPAEQTFIAQLTGTYGAYLPTARAVAAGGYGAEIANTLVGPEGGRKLVDRTIELLDEIF